MILTRRIGVHSRHRATPARSIVVARSSDGMEPNAILGAIGMIATLLLVWTGLVL
jgi:hypothetical protein